MISFLHGYEHLHETNANAREREARIADNAAKLLEGE